MSTKKKRGGHPPPKTREAIIAALKKHGPMDRSEICDAIGRDQDSLSSTLDRMRKGGFIFIKEWRRRTGGRGGSAAAIYAHDSRPGIKREDAPRPGPQPRQQWGLVSLDRLKKAKRKTGLPPRGALDLMARELRRI